MLYIDPDSCLGSKIIREKLQDVQPACLFTKKLFLSIIAEDINMTRQEIIKEKEIISFRILESIQEKKDINQLTNLLARQSWLSSEIKEESNHCNHTNDNCFLTFPEQR